MRLVSRTLGALAAITVAVVAFPGTASAHVSVSPDEAVQGGFTRIAFRVPTESDTASTTKVEINLPEDAPVAEVSTMPVPGWTVNVQTRKLATPLTTDDGAQITDAVSVVTWTATAGSAVKPGQFQEFPISLGPLPKVDQMVLKTLQTYSDGTIVRWIELPGADGKGPEHPAPILHLVAAAATPAATPASATPAASVPTIAEGGSSDGLARTLSIAALVVALGTLALLLVRRRPTT